MVRLRLPRGRLLYDLLKTSARDFFRKEPGREHGMARCNDSHLMPSLGALLSAEGVFPAGRASLSPDCLYIPSRFTLQSMMPVLGRAVFGRAPARIRARQAYSNSSLNIHARSSRPGKKQETRNLDVAPVPLDHARLNLCN